MPASRITAADVDRQAVHFCVREFGLKGLVVPSDPRRACFPDNYDLIFVGSLLTHLPVPTRLALLDVLVGVFVRVTVGVSVTVLVEVDVAVGGLRTMSSKFAVPLPCSRGSYDKSAARQSLAA